jgi:predicted house-cleaning noncanonical NTP pyrophosphatase (MazG superfamily)
MKKQEVKTLVRDLVREGIEDPDQKMTIHEIKDYFEDKDIYLSV